ncbi:MAG: hypothetical protein ABSF70_20180 [Terracidiphilus sp.]
MRPMRDEEIVSCVKREMNKPRLTESVRNGKSCAAAPVVHRPVAQRVKACTLKDRLGDPKKTLPERTPAA